MTETEQPIEIAKESKIKAVLDKAVGLMRAHVSVGLFSLIVAAGALTFNYLQSRSNERISDLQRMREIITQQQNPGQNPIFGNALGQSMAASELDRIFKKYPNDISPELLLAMGSALQPGDDTAYAASWYKQALRLVEERDIKSPLLNFVAHWYVAGQLEREGKHYEAKSHYDFAQATIASLPITRRRTFYFQMRLSQAMNMMVLGKADACRRLMGEVQKEVANDGRWVDLQIFRSQWEGLNNCQPRAIFFGPQALNKLPFTTR